MSTVALRATALLALLGTAPAGLPQDPDDPPPPRRGAYQATFDERHPDGEIRQQAKRFRWKLSFVKENDPEGGEYDIAKESFRVVVPESYSPDEPWGLLVSISPAPTGHLPPDWPEVLERRKLIAVGPDRAGNERLIWYRVGLALDAVHNLARQYSIDEERIYVTGFSGGARLASRLGMHYPEVFRGGLYMGGCNFWDDIPTPDDPKLVWPARFPKPTGKRLRLAKKESRHVVFVGAQDFNLPQSKAIFERLEGKEKFAHVHWLEQPEVGHVWADAAWFEAAIELLDAPLGDE